MKVSTTKPQFTPVVITLETQEEVDQMHAIMRAEDVCPSDSALGDCYPLLCPVASEASDNFYHAMRSRMRSSI